MIKIMLPYTAPQPDVRRNARLRPELVSERHRKDIEHGSKNVTSDLACLLDALNLPRTVLIGNDWGGAIVWLMCLFHPYHVLAVCGVLTSFSPPVREPRDLYVRPAVAQVPAAHGGLEVRG